MNPFEKAVQEKLRHHCESCKWMRKRLATDKITESAHQFDTHWCSKPGLDMPTKPLSLRCGGDDWEARYG